MSLVLPEIASDLELWLSVLADNELDGTQRLQLLQYLELHPRNWRACAVALLDQQLIASQIGQSPDLHHRLHCERDDSATAPQKIDVGRPDKNWRSVNMAIVAMAAAIGILILGAWTMRLGFETERLAWDVSLEAKQQQISRLSKRLSVEGLIDSSPSLAGLYPDKPLLIEIENTADRTLYLTDRAVSDAVLESFAAAGHVVDVRPYQPRLMTNRMRSLPNPVLVVEVYKFKPTYLVQGDSQ